MGLNREVAEKYCDYLVGLEFLKKKDGKYGLTPLARHYLVKSSSHYLGNYISFYKSWRTEGDHGFTEALTKGPKQGKNGDLWVYDETSWLALAEGSAISIPRMIKVLEKYTKMSSMKKILDLGGGHGLFAVAFAETNKDAEAVVFDLPDVIENAAKANISAYGNSQISTISGDMVGDDIGKGYDLVQASDSLYLTAESLRIVLEKVHTSLNKNGVLSVKSGFLGPTVEDSSRGALLFDLCTSIAGKGEVVHHLDSFLQMLFECGFKVLKVLNFRDLEGNGTLIIAQKM